MKTIEGVLTINMINTASNCSPDPMTLACFCSSVE